MDRFAVRYADIGEAWESVRDATGQIRTKLADLDGSLGPLRATWTGQAAESFEINRATWVREAEEMTEFLDDMAKLLSLIDENYQNAHQANLALWDTGGGAGGSGGAASTVAMSAGAAGGPAGEVDVSIEELRRAAQSFHGLQQQLASNMEWTSRNLHGSAANMAGADSVVEPWRALYDDTVRALWEVLAAATDMLGGIAQGMTDTGNNYVDAEEASVADRGATLPERLPQLPVDTVRPGAEPPPSGSAPVEDDDYAYYPDANPDQLMFASDEWKNLYAKLGEISSSGENATANLVESNRGEVFDRLRQYWISRSPLCGTSEILPVIRNTCSALIDSCNVLSKAARRAHRSVAKRDEIAQELDSANLFDSLGLLRKSYLVKLAEIGTEAGRYGSILMMNDDIKDRYERERNEAMKHLSTVAVGLHDWAGKAEAVTLESERQAYDRADHGLEQHLTTSQFDAWADVPGPHPDPASVHITEERGGHITVGDPPPSTGGGHMSGIGRKDKTEFPPGPGWTDDEILNKVQDVAKNPDSAPEYQEGFGRWAARGTRDGVYIEVIINPDGSVRTAYPLAGPGVTKNPRTL